MRKTWVGIMIALLFAASKPSIAEDEVYRLLTFQDVPIRMELATAELYKAVVDGRTPPALWSQKSDDAKIDDLCATAGLQADSGDDTKQKALKLAVFLFADIPDVHAEFVFSTLDVQQLKAEHCSFLAKEFFAAERRTEWAITAMELLRRGDASKDACKRVHFHLAADFPALSAEAGSRWLTMEVGDVLSSHLMAREKVEALCELAGDHYSSSHGRLMAPAIQSVIAKAYAEFAKDLNQEELLTELGSIANAANLRTGDPTQVAMAARFEMEALHRWAEREKVGRVLLESVKLRLLAPIVNDLNGLKKMLANHVQLSARRHAENTKRFDETINALEALKRQLEQDRGKFQRQIAELDQQIAGLRRETAQLKQAVESMKVSNKVILERMEDFDKRIDELKLNDPEVFQAIQDVNYKVGKIQEWIDRHGSGPPGPPDRFPMHGATLESTRNRSKARANATLSLQPDGSGALRVTVEVAFRGNDLEAALGGHCFAFACVSLLDAKGNTLFDTRDERQIQKSNGIRVPKPRGWYGEYALFRIPKEKMDVIDRMGIAAASDSDNGFPKGLDGWNDVFTKLAGLTGRVRQIVEDSVAIAGVFSDDADTGDTTKQTVE